MAKDVTLVYSGPPVRVVEIDREVEDGDEVTVPADLAPRLLAASGFREKGKKAPGEEAVKLASRSVLEDRATELGLQLYPTETDEALASRIKSHGGNAEPGEPDPEPDPVPPTPKGDSE
jgi:hypothetical protein